MDAEVEIIFEAWLYKLQGSPYEKSTFQFTSPWKRRYFILLRKGSVAHLNFYEKKPKVLKEVPKGVVVLDKNYLVEKHGKVRGKDYACSLHMTGFTLTVAAEDEKLYHLFLFFIHTQTRLRQELEGECFVVRPETSDEMRRLGARGNMCLLHISKWGVTLTLQLSKCVLSQWPLNCIKTYETRGRGQFCMETGSRSISGPGLFIFNMRIGQENNAYDTLDRFVNEVAGLRQIVKARSSEFDYNSTDSTEHQLDLLRELTEPWSDATFIPQLKRISRDIYDHLAEHLGASMATRLDETPSTSANDNYRTVQQRSQNIDIVSPTHRSESQSPASVGIPSSATSNRASATSARSASVSSQYLHMSSPSTSHPTPDAISPPKPPMMEWKGAAQADHTDGKKSVQNSNEARAPLSGEFSALRQRLRSRSFDDLNDYARMSMHLHKDAEPVPYENDSAILEHSQESTRDESMYSYAKSPGTVSNKSSPYLFAKALPGGMRRSVSNPDLLENSPPNQAYLEPVKMPGYHSEAQQTQTRDSAFSKSPSPPVQDNTFPKKGKGKKPLIKGFSMSSQSQVFTRSKMQASPQSAEVPASSLLRHQDSINRMHGRRLPSLPPQDFSGAKRQDSQAAALRDGAHAMGYNAPIDEERGRYERVSADVETTVTATLC